MYGERVEKPKNLRSALRAALRHKGPALLDIVTDPNALSIPPKIKAEMVTGFAPLGQQDGAGGGRRQDGPDGPLQPPPRTAPVTRPPVSPAAWRAVGRPVRDGAGTSGVIW
ncbi:hypothetical protein TPA0910_00110 [Streptomyces hygroscopicus subsp. sporocinereus]|uniref:Thiamine pyrophosphate enzyme TPP-binding domain-containing protein n=1 Tax=Streptomyces hygroscopicus TaxID=1912 RepID=A0ABQ3TQF0_STRHY|nr:hypothetical protein TPA0910_00110 [Streptomyces hygroscopicus]